jgi:hypothetical protein
LSLIPDLHSFEELRNVGILRQGSIVSSSMLLGQLLFTDGNQLPLDLSQLFIEFSLHTLLEIRHHTLLLRSASGEKTAACFHGDSPPRAAFGHNQE